MIALILIGLLFQNPAPAAKAKSEPVLVKSPAPARGSNAGSKTSPAPLNSAGGYMLQVAAMSKEADALELAKQLQKKKLDIFVQ